MPNRSSTEEFLRNATRNDLVSKIRTQANSVRALEDELGRQGDELEEARAALKEKTRTEFEWRKEALRRYDEANAEITRLRDIVLRVGKAQSTEFSKALRECVEEANGS